MVAIPKIISPNRSSVTFHFQIYHCSLTNLTIPLGTILTIPLGELFSIAISLTIVQMTENMTGLECQVL